MRNISAAIFDMDGLLIDSERIALQLFEQTCQQYALSDTESLHQLFLSCVGTNAAENDRRVRVALADKIDADQFLIDWEKRYSNHMRHTAVPVKEGAIALLDALERRDIPTAVATSSKTHDAIQRLKNCNLDRRFKSIIGGEQVHKSKPEPDIFLKAAESIGVAPANCLAFEDSFNGVHAAVAAGMQVIQVPDLIEPSEDLLALGHHVVPSLASVERLVWPDQ